MNRALVISGDAWHSVETVRSGLAPLHASGFEFEFFEGSAQSLEAGLRDFRIVVLAKANMISAADHGKWMSSGTMTTLRDHLRRGNGLLVIHGGTSRYEQSPGMREIIGGGFLRHPPGCEVTIEPRSAHPLTGGVANFTVRDEHYFMGMNEDETLDVFLHSRSEHGVQPAGWTRAEGDGRVCVMTPGHHLEVWLHPSYQKLLLNALRWTAKLN